MNDSVVILTNLTLLIPLAVFAWHFAASSIGVPRLFFLICALVLSVPLGGTLAAAIALVYGEPIAMNSFSWVDHPTYALRVFATCSVVGGLFSYGLAKAFPSAKSSTVKGAIWTKESAS